MPKKLLTITNNPEDRNEENQIFTMKDLNKFLEEGWDIEDRTEAGDGLMNYVLKKTEPTQHEVVVREPERRGGGSLTVSEQHNQAQLEMERKFGVGVGGDTGERILSTLDNLGNAVSSGSHLGGISRQAIPGVTIVSSQEIGMARDMGVNAAHLGWSPSQCPFPEGSRPWHLWMEGYKMGGNALDEVVEKDFDDFNDDEKLAYKQGSEEALADKEEAYCPYVGGPLYLAWLKGFSKNGGKIG